MDKLIELLNEWQEKELGKAGAKYLMFDGINKVFRLNNNCSLCQELVLSHRFGFIKRLVENDKINTFQLAIYIEYHSDYRFVANRELRDKNVDEDHLLMLLSIEDNPIEFLISILK